MVCALESNSGEVLVVGDDDGHMDDVRKMTAVSGM
jgi:hypothetical protein